MTLSLPIHRNIKPEEQEQRLPEDDSRNWSYADTYEMPGDSREWKTEK